MFAMIRNGARRDIRPSAPKIPSTMPMIWLTTEMTTVSMSPFRIWLSGLKIACVKTSVSNLNGARLWPAQPATITTRRSAPTSARAGRGTDTDPARRAPSMFIVPAFPAAATTWSCSAARPRPP